MIYDPERRTVIWKGEDVPLRSEAAFRVERATMRNLVAEGMEWMEVRGRDSYRRVHVTMARRLATVQGHHVLIPWRCWQRIDYERPDPVEDAITQIVAATIKGRSARASQRREDAGQQRMG